MWHSSVRSHCLHRPCFAKPGPRHLPLSKVEALRPNASPRSCHISRGQLGSSARTQGFSHTSRRLSSNSLRRLSPTCRAASAAVASPAEQTCAASQLLDELSKEGSGPRLLEVISEGEAARLTASRDIAAGTVSLGMAAHYPFPFMHACLD